MIGGVKIDKDKDVEVGFAWSI